ncbi:MAG: N-6 DNA methylase [Bacteroidetes bacterium]|nr:N-6 DNA methylase [Bacteroidota bacterium]MCL1968924.1 N-6 DNA methylase [Bacteroidota bacterium]
MPTKEDALKKIESLVERFNEQKAFYKHKDYNETQTRQDFINPFWKALGWDMDNENGYAESYREVAHEDRIKVGGTTKAPDYTFKLMGVKKLFFLEAKRPSIDIKTNAQPALQVRRYGWNAKLPISIISNFEGLAIYDCTKKPNQTDSASTARIKYITYTDYIKEFDFIWNTFSREYVPKGNFDKYIGSDTNKKGTTTVDEDFLASLDKWRAELASDIASNNSKKGITEDKLAFIVHNLLHRIIFLRIAEDRGAEPYGDLRKVIENGDYYKNLIERFQLADKKYNSGLFDFTKDNISAQLNVGKGVIKKIILELYYPHCPYEFSVLPIEVLGSAYEQFLGKQIKLSKGNKATIETKPEIRKAGGVYYTPQYIVDYIVKNTVGKLTTPDPSKGGELTPEDVAKIKICDPACGSGSFLIGAYQYLLNWHKEYYTKKIPSYPPPLPLLHSYGLTVSPLTPIGELTTAEKKRILLNNIYGVDLDDNAVEVTKLSLLLKCMEGETYESIETETKLHHDRVLPTLDHNIKCGNSLIDLDYFDQELDNGEERKIKPFSWEKNFPEVFDRLVPAENINPFIEHSKKVWQLQKEAEALIAEYTVREPDIKHLVRASGFDCVIGNPPYGAEYGNDIKNYLSYKYKLPIPIADTYLMFLQQAYNIAKNNGIISFIIPSTWLYMPKFKEFRKTIISEKTLKEIQLFRKQVFTDATVETCIIIIENRFQNNYTYKYKEIKEEPNSFLGETIFQNQIDVLNSQEYKLILSHKEEENLFENIRKNNTLLKDIALTVCGLTPYRKGKGDPPQTEKIVKNREYDADYRKDDTYRKYLMGRDFNKYQWHIEKERWISYGKWLAEPRYKAPFDDEKKIVIRQTADKLIAHLDTEKYLSLKNVHNVRITIADISYEYLLAIINSKLLNWWYQNLIPEKGRVFAEVKVVNLEKLPIKIIDLKNITEVQQQKQIIKLVNQLLQLNKELQTATLPNHRDQIQSKIGYCEDKINAIVYELYELTEEEIKMVEMK